MAHPVRAVASIAAATLLVAGAAGAQVPEVERDALITLLQATWGQGGWSCWTNWLGPAGTECTWYGVSCSGGHVEGLRLYSNHLMWSIPSELENLEDLEDLDLDSNQLTGSIPPELGNLARLENLNLYSNQLTGSIPPELGNLASLKHLYLSWNHLTGSIPPELGGLTSLQSLVLGANQLTGSVPPELGSLASLRLLSLGSNQLTGSIPPALGNLASLQYLRLDSNHLTDSIPPELGGLTGLESCFLYSNHLTGSFPPELGNLASLQYLRLDSNQLTGSIPPELGDLTSLGQLGLAYNALYTNDPALQAFLDSKDPGWSTTQTIAPSGIVAGSPTEFTVSFSWTPITFTGYSGGYEVLYSTTSGGPYTSAYWTETKSDTSFLVTDLDPGTPYYLVIRTFTEPHQQNPGNRVVSEPSAEIPVTTTSAGCVEPTITVTGCGTYTLEASPGFESYQWSPGGQTGQIIEVTPPWLRRYVVETTGPGACAEAASTVVGECLLADGFETGDTSGWALTAP